MRHVLERGRVWDFEDLPVQSIALDGAVVGPRIDPEQQRYSFDHHGDCLRLATRATCEQVLDALRLGLDPTGFTVYLNDLDSDSVLALWLLENPARSSDPEVDRLVRAIGALDAHGPAYPLQDAELCAGLQRALGGRETVEDCLGRLTRWIDSGMPPAPLDDPSLAPPSILDQGTWALVVGEWTSQPGGAAALYARGWDRLVLCTPCGPDRWLYTLARRSDLVAGFPIPTLLAELERAENASGSNTPWGGGSSIGGGPRAGSRLSPEQVSTLIERVLCPA